MNIWEKQYQKLGFDSERRYPNEALVQFLAIHFFPFPSKKRLKTKILEIGCGSGANLWIVAKEGFDTYGIDYSPTGIKLCQKMLDLWQTKAKIELGNMKKLNFKDGFFDSIFDVRSMQHVNLADHIKSYKEAFRCLKRGGRFFQFHIGARSICFLNGGGNYIDKLTIDKIVNPDVPLNMRGLVCFLTPTDAREMLHSAGFKNIEIEIVSRTFKNMTQTVEYLSIQAQKL